MGNSITLLKSEIIENVEVVWYKDDQLQFGVEIRNKTAPHHLPKTWHFEDSSVSEAFSYYWFDYVVKTIKKFNEVPKAFIMMDNNDVQDMLVRILKNL